MNLNPFAQMQRLGRALMLPIAVLPVAGLVVSLAVITLLRAADRAQSSLAVRRSVRGPRASESSSEVSAAAMARNVS